MAIKISGYKAAQYKPGEQVQRYIYESLRLARLATPILIAQLAQTAMTLVDTIMAGQVSATDLAAVAVASSIWLPVILFVQGMIMALTPIVAQLNGARRHHEIPAAVFQAIYLALLITIPALLILYFSPLLLQIMGVEPQLAEKTAGFLHAIMCGMPAYALYMVLRNYSEGLSHTLPTMWFGFIGLLINIPINYLLIYGKWGLPALGGVGCGVASALVFWFMLIGMVFYVHKATIYQHCRLHFPLPAPEWAQIKRIIQLGYPIALALFFEVTLFALVAMLLAPSGSQIVASHQIALNVSTLVFMLPLSLGYAVTIRVGHAMGEKRPDQARVATLTGLGTGLLLALLTAWFTYHGRYWIADQYSNDPTVIALAAALMVYAAIYQFSDTVQAVGAGALRGYKDTRIIFAITLFSYWVLGLPTGMILGLTDWICPKMGPFGFWIGFIVGLTGAAILFGIRLRFIFKKNGVI